MSLRVYSVRAGAGATQITRVERRSQVHALTMETRFCERNSALEPRSLPLQTKFGLGRTGGFSFAKILILIALRKPRRETVAEHKSRFT